MEIILDFGLERIIAIVCSSPSTSIFRKPAFPRMSECRLRGGPRRLANRPLEAHRGVPAAALVRTRDGEGLCTAVETAVGGERRPLTRQATLADVRSAQCRADGLSHGDERLVACGGRVVAHMNLDAVGDGHASPAGRALVIRVAHGDVGLRAEGRCK